MTRPRHSLTPEQKRVLSALWKIRVERELLDREEIEAVMLGRRLGISWRVMAEQLDMPFTTLRDRVTGQHKGIRRKHDRRHLRGKMDPTIDTQIFMYRSEQPGFERDIQHALSRGQTIKVCRHKATEPCNDSCEIRTPDARSSD